MERPSFAVVKAAKDALPKDDEVAKIKRQFKDGQRMAGWPRWLLKHCDHEKHVVDVVDLGGFW